MCIRDRPLPERAVRPQTVVEPPPAGDEDLRLLERVEEFAVQEFVTQLAVERLDVAVLPGGAGLDEQGGDAEVTEPFAHRLGDELGTVVAPDVFGDAVLKEEVGQDPEHDVGGHAALHADRQALARVLVDDGEQAQLSAVVGGFGYEVVGPDVVSVFRPQADARSVIQPEAAPLGLTLRYPEALAPPDALYALGVHVPARHLQEAGDALVAVAAEGTRQADDGCGQGVLVVAQLRLATLAAAMLAESTAGPPFGDAQPLTDCRHALAAARGAQKFPRDASWRMTLSRERSETALRRRAFSRSRSLRRFAWEPLRPPYSLRQRS